MSTALISSAAAIIIAILGGLGGLVGHAFNRIRDVEQASADRVRELEAKVDVLQRDNYYYWMWARALVDYAYRYRRPESPDPPTLEDTKQRQERQS